MTQPMYQPFVSSAKNKKYSVYVKSTSGNKVSQNSMVTKSSYT